MVVVLDVLSSTASFVGCTALLPADVGMGASVSE